MNDNKKETSIGIIPLLVGNLRWPTAPLFKSSFENLNKTKEDGGVEKVNPSEILLNKNRENGAAPVGGVGGQENENR